MYYVYFIQSAKSQQTYVGFSSKKPEERLQDHNGGRVASTKKYRPYKLVYFEEYECKADTLKREKFYKSGFGKQIKNLIVQCLGKK